MKRGPRILDGSPRRPCRAVLAVRVPEGTAAALDARAAAEGMTAASIVRRTLVQAFGCDPQDMQPAPRFRRPCPAPTLDVVRLAELREVTGELNGTLRQVAGLSRHAGAGAVWSEVEDALPRLRGIIAALDDMKEAAMRPPAPEEGRP